MLLKVCGATSEADLSLLARTPANWTGLWYGVTDGHADLPLPRLAALAAQARAHGLKPVVVTLLDDPGLLRRAVDESAADTVQLHGFLPPRQLAAVRRALPHTTLVKVLHVARGRVLEHAWIPAYQQCGADVFLFDSLGDDGRVGSTGTPLDGPAAAGALDRVDRPFLLAGGLSDPSHGSYRELLRHPGLLGIDIDTAARDAEGRYDPARVVRMASAWRKEIRDVRTH